MKINVSQPRDQSLEAIAQAIENGTTIRRSPHVGNVPAGDLALLSGLAALGANVAVELVDTIHGNDNYSKPRKILLTNTEFNLTSLKQSRSKVVGACVVSTEGAESALANGIDGISAGKSLAQIHIDALTRALPSEVRVESSTDYFRSLGAELLRQAILEASSIIERPIREVDDEGKIHDAESLNLGNLFGVGENPLSGTLPPLEAMMAIELIDTAINARGSDAQAVHVAGNDMAKYTANTQLMDKVKLVASKIASHFAVPHCVNVEYCLPTRSDLLAHPQFPMVLPGSDIRSQYDLLTLVEV